MTIDLNGHDLQMVASDTVAIVLAEDGKIYDHCFTWESGQSYARDGYVVRATADDGFMTAAEAQSLYNYELEIFSDCFNLPVPTVPLTLFW